MTFATWRKPLPISPWNPLRGTFSSMSGFGDDWAVLFSHPADYTPSVPTELGAFAKPRTSSPVAGVS